jgi:hypothetical protein
VVATSTARVTTALPTPPPSRTSWTSLVNKHGRFELNLGFDDSNISITAYKTLPDDKAVFKNYQSIACARCATKAERPADYTHGICVYATKLKKGTVTGKVVKDSVNSLIEHGCARCGSVPVVPGAKDDTDGNIQINFTQGACETGLCPGGPGTVKQNSNVASRIDSAPSKDKSFKQPYTAPNNIPGISARSTAPDSATTLLGIESRGSSMCNNI